MVDQLVDELFLYPIMQNIHIWWICEHALLHDLSYDLKSG